MISSRKFPEPGDLVIGTVISVESFGLYVSLDEYGGLRGFVSVKEIPSTMTRNLVSFFKPKQKVVLKVLYTNPGKLQVDLSLRRVTGDERRKKMASYKQEVGAARALDVAKAKAGIKDDRPIREVMISAFGSLQGSLRALVEDRARVLDAVANAVKGVDRQTLEKYLEAAAQLAAERLKPKRAVISVEAKVYSPASSGINVIKEALSRAAGAAASTGAKVRVTYAGSPRYLIRLEADNYKSVEAALEEFSRNAEESLKGRGHFELLRGK
ncbi:S1 RNA-binding domain-containing protein [Conexivisphaera calida]|uniref:S1 RNA-binding domain-containing protein n=1 Tax=Conexivisphaera calida TaxID=1874277 RepID=UPI00157AA55F|nr:S1 RNA-binding domain-containing protein [Conexivisphaera calida]